ncbi:MAG: OmpA family protein, partial [Pyrinomonadaceae bacterium]
SAILQAKQAVALARFAGAERDATVELNEAETLLQNAQNAWLAGRDSDTIDIAARKSISSSVKAESVAQQRKEAREKRNEKTRTDSEIRAAENKFSDAQEQMADLRSELARETRNRELAERDALNYSSQVKELRDENGRLRDDLGRVRAEVETANAKLAAAETEKKAIQQQSEKETKAANLRAAEATLITTLKAYGTVAKTERGIVLTLPESLWAGPRSSNLLPQADGKLTSLGEILAGNPDYRISVESHTDNSGVRDQIQSITEKRSYAVAEKFSALGVDEGRIVAKGFGAGVPVAPNTTNANRAKNRRLQVVLSLYNP